MRRAALVAGLLGLGFALGPAAPAVAQDAAYSDWNSAYAGFPSNVARDATKDCTSGSRACIDRTVAEMYRRFHTVIPRCEHNAVFSLTYIRVTEDIRRGIDAGFYPELVWINHLDAIFARVYFAAYDNWAAGRRELVPPAWRIAFDTAHGREVEGIGNLLLSMNGHINRDFPFMLWHAGLTQPDGTSRKDEHDSGNARLRAMYKPMLAELAQRFDDSIDDYDAPGTDFDDEAIFSILVDWREAAWRNAERLAAAPTDADRRMVASDIEAQAEAEARFIQANTAYKPGAGPAARDARCARFGGQDPAWGQAGARPALRGAVARAVSPGRRGLRVSPRGLVRVTLRCPPGGGACAGTVHLRAARRRIGERAFELSAGARRTFALRVTAGARARLQTRAGLRVRIAVRSLLDPAHVAWRTSTTHLSPARAQR
ncbi:MAG: hypothetical protein QOE65_697 [Solirubrobacteraceae bacterium]|nr:hypothetical protein [Solirubrobacteraceae bacterium]